LKGSKGVKIKPYKILFYRALLTKVVELAIEKSNHFEKDLELLARLFKLL
tara:strand:+ start:3410 stop:3559 length:150 start_codon:yes stop_codon:yes gene_type:complete